METKNLRKSILLIIDDFRSREYFLKLLNHKYNITVLKKLSPRLKSVSNHYDCAIISINNIGVNDNLNFYYFPTFAIPAGYTGKIVAQEALALLKRNVYDVKFEIPSQCWMESIARAIKIFKYFYLQ